MARHLRLEYEGAIYHVTSRGNERSDILSLDGDKQRFTEKLAENVERHHVRLYAYVVMSNHYHLLLETPRVNLAAFFVESGLAEDDGDLREAMQRSSKAVGGWRFCRQVERDYRRRRRRAGAEVDVAMRRVEAGVDPAEVTAQVARAFKTAPEELRKRRSLSDGRLVAALLLKELTGLSQRDIGRHVGLGDGSGLGRLLKGAEGELASRGSLRRRYATLRKTLCT